MLGYNGGGEGRTVDNEHDGRLQVVSINIVLCVCEGKSVCERLAGECTIYSCFVIMVLFLSVYLEDEQFDVIWQLYTSYSPWSTLISWLSLVAVSVTTLCALHLGHEMSVYGG